MEKIKPFDQFIKEEFTQQINENIKLDDKSGYIVNIEEETELNDDYRRVLYTSDNMQLVIMSIKPGEEIGSETHDDGDQFIRIEEGDAIFVLDGTECEVSEDFAAVIPSGIEHNVINSGEDDLKLYVLYTPPEHEKGSVEPDKQ